MKNSHNKEIEVEVTVSITLSKTIKINTTNYNLDEWEHNGEHYQQIILGNLEEDLYQQIVLPHQLPNFVETTFKVDKDLHDVGSPRYLKEALKQSKDWNLDELEIIPE